MENKQNDEFAEEIKEIVREGIAQGIAEERANARRERDEFHSSIRKMAQESRIIK